VTYPTLLAGIVSQVIVRGAEDPAATHGPEDLATKFSAR
jgi:hypothetical protein